jgi:multicomponent K+:H+ antiporter subunit G
MSAGMPWWVETIAATLLVASGLLSVTAALGLVRLRDFFQRMHPPALANTLGTWCACIASAVCVTASEGRVALHPLVLTVLLAITAPITTVLLARAALFRNRQAARDVPPPLDSRLS